MDAKIYGKVAARSGESLSEVAERHLLPEWLQATPLQLSGSQLRKITWIDGKNPYLGMGTTPLLHKYSGQAPEDQFTLAWNFWRCLWKPDPKTILQAKTTPKEEESQSVLKFK